MTETTTAVATVQPPKTVVPLNGQLSDLDQAWRLAQALALADILPKDLRGKPSNVLLTILYGQQLNVPPVIAIQTISVVKGRPQMAGKLLLAKVREAGHRASIVEHTDQSCTVHIKRGDTAEEHTETFTLADAVAANLVKLKDGKPFARSQNGEPLPWETWTKRMLLWRAAGFCADFICPEVRMGFAIEGEMDALPPEAPTLKQVAAERDNPPTAQPAPTDEEVATQVAALAEQFTEVPRAGDSRVPLWNRCTVLLATCGVTEDGEQLDVLAEIVGHPVRGMEEMTTQDLEVALLELERCGGSGDAALALGELRIELERERDEASRS